MQLVWSRTGDLGNYWFREKVDFVDTKTFKVGEARRPWCQVPEAPRWSRLIRAVHWEAAGGPRLQLFPCPCIALHRSA